jgi:DNA-binding NarL/FixJ family response regulator
MRILDGRCEGMDRLRTAPIKVLLADDHTMFRQGLANILASYGGMEVVAEVANDEEAIRLVRERKPDVVIMQVQMPFERAKESLRQMRSSSPPPKVVVVTMFEEPRYVRELMEVGANAYLVKSASAEHLMAAVRAAVFDPASRNVVVGVPRALLEGGQEGVDSVLSARELEILLLAARGLSNRQIASRINVAQATVKRHLANAYHKMDVGSRGEAVRKALSEEWITIQEVTEE